MFDESQPLQSIPRTDGGPDFTPVLNPVAGTTFVYAPTADIENPALNATGIATAVAHESQILTIFHPRTPAPGERFPTVMFHTAGFFGQAQGSPTFVPTFLGLALENDWCVVTVGGVGSTSVPTPMQPPRCTVNGGGTNPPPCRDYNLWYPPDSQTSPLPSPWNDFNVFYGEKDFVWARQWVAENAATYSIDNARIVVSGQSAGAVYASFLAFQPNRAWSGSAYSSQSQQNTRVAAYVAFAPVVWMEAIPNVPPPKTLVGAHWPRSLDPAAPANAYLTRIPLLNSGLSQTELDVLRTNGPSRYLREFLPLVPTFVEAGDNSLAVFGRDAVQVAPVDDYARDPDSVPPDDPTLSFPNDPRTKTHDLWNDLIFKQDLLAVDANFHRLHSRLYLRDDTNWTFIPAALTQNLSGFPSMPPTSFSQVPLVDGIFAGANGCTITGLSQSCSAVENLAASQQAVSWMGREVCRTFDQAVQCRNGGTNPSIHSFTPASIGATATATVQLCECPNAYDAAWVFGYDTPSATPLPSGDMLLAIDGGSGELLGFPVKTKPPSGLVTFDLDIPNDPTLVGSVLYTQAWIYDYEGGYPDTLTNAQDLEIQP